MPAATVVIPPTSRASPETNRVHEDATHVAHKPLDRTEGKAKVVSNVIRTARLEDKADLKIALLPWNEHPVQGAQSLEARASVAGRCADRSSGDRRRVPAAPAPASRHDSANRQRPRRSDQGPHRRKHRGWIGNRGRRRESAGGRRFAPQTQTSGSRPDAGWLGAVGRRGRDRAQFSKRSSQYGEFQPKKAGTRVGVPHLMVVVATIRPISPAGLRVSAATTERRGTTRVSMPSSSLLMADTTTYGSDFPFGSHALMALAERMSSWIHEAPEVRGADPGHRRVNGPVRSRIGWRATVKRGRLP